MGWAIACVIIRGLGQGSGIDRAFIGEHSVLPPLLLSALDECRLRRQQRVAPQLQPLLLVAHLWGGEWEWERWGSWIQTD